MLEDIPEVPLPNCKDLEAKVPSYVGISCAISGYRTLNKYDATIREGLHAHNSPTRIALPRGKDGKILHISSDVPFKTDENCAALYQSQREINPSCKHRENMNTSSQPATNGSLNCTSRVEMQKFSSTMTNHESSFSTSDKFLVNGSKGNESPDKSFIQQRIERLYGPAALGMVFYTKRAQLEHLSDSSYKKNNESISVDHKVSPTGLPSVFKHLRPEFCHQLPLKSKRTPNESHDSSTPTSDRNNINNYVVNNNNSVRQNGQNIRHIPIQLEDPSSSETMDLPDQKTHTNDIKLSVKPKFSLVQGHLDKVEDNLCLKKNLNTNSHVKSSDESSSLISDVKDGHYFLKIVDGEVKRLESLVVRVDQDLEVHGKSMTEEVRGKLFAASGKTKLFIRQKINQFKGLCHKNINKSSEEEFPTTLDDLAGFWDMVTLQVEDIANLIAEIDALRNNQWKEPIVSAVPTNKKKEQKRPSKSVSRKVAPKATSDQAKANEERRKAMREAINSKRKAALASKCNNEGDVEIFVSTKQ